MSASDHSTDTRIGELILLESMFPASLVVDDLQVRHAVSEQNYGHVCEKQIACTFSADKALDIHFVLPVGYPREAPAIHCRILDGSIPNSGQKWLNERVVEEIRTLSDEDMACDVITVIQRVQDLWRDFDRKCFAVNGSAVDVRDRLDSNGDEERDCDSDAVSSGESKSLPSEDQRNDLTRYWIYSHHIKSTVKRKLIADLAHQFKLNGFIHSGKPGFICVEGSEWGCESFWCEIRAVNWQRITLIESEPNLLERAFERFEEINDNSLLFRTLEAKQCASVVKKFLGFQP